MEPEKDSDSSDSLFNWILWWRVDSNTLNKQVAEYATLKFYQTARGISLIFLLFSVIATGLLIFLHSIDISAVIDMVIFVFFGFFIYRGHKWAMIGIMLFWTLEKSYQIYNLTQLPHFNLIVPILWWAFYMHAFYLAYKVEVLRSQSQKITEE